MLVACELVCYLQKSTGTNCRNHLLSVPVDTVQCVVAGIPTIPVAVFQYQYYRYRYLWRSTACRYGLLPESVDKTISRRYEMR